MTADCCQHQLIGHTIDQSQLMGDCQLFRFLHFVFFPLSRADRAIRSISAAAGKSLDDFTVAKSVETVRNDGSLLTFMLYGRKVWLVT